jgi:hypothetical protein
MNKTQKHAHGKNGLLPFSVIAKATSGDIEAIEKVLKHYEGYIVVLSTRRFYDEYGNPHLFVDNELRQELENKLVARILAFDVA